MAKYTYEYTQNSELNMELKIYVPTTIVYMVLSPEIPDHALMIAMFTNQDKLEKYVDYLGDDPNRPFNMQEIINL